MLRFAIAATLAFCALVSTADEAEARRSRGGQGAQVAACGGFDVMRPCSVQAFAGSALAQPRARARHALKPAGRHNAAGTSQAYPGASQGLAAHSIGGAAAAQIVAHPAGCPSRAFCGCGAAVRVFGRPDRSLWLAAAWYRFPRAAPGAGMVAVRRHHVFVLEQHLGGSTWLAYDANSGGRATRIHARSIAGYTIVNPRGGA